MKKFFYIIAFLSLVLFLSFEIKAAGDKWSGFDENGVAVLPKALAEYCNIKQEEVKNMADVVQCLNDILRLRQDPSGEVQVQAQQLSELILRQSVYISVSEGMGQKIYAFEYPDKVLQKLSDTLGNSTDNKELISAIMMIEKQSAELQNKLLMLKASDMQLKGIKGFNGYREKL